MKFDQLFKRISLPVKLMLIGLIPLLLLIYVSTQLIAAQGKKLNLLESYIKRIQQSSDISKLIYNLQLERRYSFEYALKGGMKIEMLQQRNTTDSFFQKLRENYSENLGDFPAYTFLSDLGTNRKRIDSSQMDANSVMHFYTTAIFRLNTLNAVAAGNNDYVKPVYKELVSQKILSDLLTYMSIIRINIYNVLYTRKYMIETLMGTLGTYDIYVSYQKEFLQKAPDHVLDEYHELMNNPSLKKTVAYIDTLFHTFKFDSTYDHQQWWNISLAGISELRNFQTQLLTTVAKKINAIYKKEQKTRTLTIILLISMIVLVTIIILYTIRSITRVLLDLKKAAQRIAEGASDIQIRKVSNDVIGSLADSILRIDLSNRSLAEAAHAIGKGNFDVNVHPRSKDDILGNAIIQMKNDLQHFTREMKELEKRKDTFITMASHELKTPITSIKGYVQLLLASTEKDEQKPLTPLQIRSSLVSVDKQIARITRLISELLDLSKIERGTLELTKEKFSLNELAIETAEDILYINPDARINVFHDAEVNVFADKDRIGQVIINMLTNAIKYSPPQSRIDMEIFKVSDKMGGLRVKDEGIGIEKNEQEKIFDRFYRASGKVEQTYPGFGIGLFIAREFIQKHGGQITVESIKGKGSVFTFTIPAI